jgi:hypothetical protein
MIREFSGGYGIFTTSFIKEGEIIEECIIAKDMVPIGSDVLNEYKFRGKSISHTEYEGMIILGKASLLNHSIEHQNVEIEQNPKYERVIAIRAIKDIQPEEQLYWYYGGRP